MGYIGASNIQYIDEDTVLKGSEEKGYTVGVKALLKREELSGMTQYTLGDKIDNARARALAKGEKWTVRTKGHTYRKRMPIKDAGSRKNIKLRIEVQMPDGGWTTMPNTDDVLHLTKADCERVLASRIQEGMVARIVRIYGTYSIKRTVIKEEALTVAVNIGKTTAEERLGQMKQGVISKKYVPLEGDDKEAEEKVSEQSVKDDNREAIIAMSKGL